MRANFGVLSTQTTHEFKTVLCLQEKFDRLLEDSCFLELDSSNDTKFSRHLVVLVPGACFRSNLHAGRFVEEMCVHAEAQACSFQVVKVWVPSCLCSLKDGHTDHRHDCFQQSCFIPGQCCLQHLCANLEKWEVRFSEVEKIWGT